MRDNNDDFENDDIEWGKLVATVALLCITLIIAAALAWARA